MPLVLCRHGERRDYVDPAWRREASRVWDPPLTDTGALVDAIARAPCCCATCSY